MALTLKALETRIAEAEAANQQRMNDILAAVNGLISNGQQAAQAAPPQPVKTELEILQEEVATLRRNAHAREQLAKETFSQPPAVRKSSDEVVNHALAVSPAVVVPKGQHAASDFGRDAFSRKVSVTEKGRTDGLDRRVDKTLFMKDGNRQKAFDDLQAKYPVIHLTPIDPRTGEVVGNAIELKLRSSSWQPDENTIGNVMYGGQNASTMIEVNGNIYTIAAASGDVYFTLKRREK